MIVHTVLSIHFLDRERKELKIDTIVIKMKTTLLNLHDKVSLMFMSLQVSEETPTR